jgi:tetratricopeptide (TPR) repeat protein
VEIYMKKPLFMLFFLAIVFVPTVFGVDIYVDYLDGYLDVMDSGEWYELYIGDSITDADTIRLDENSVAELSLPGTKLTLTKPGIYVVADLLEATGERRSLGIASVIGSKIRTIVEEPKQAQTAVMGVRGAKSEDELEWMSGDTAELLETGKDYLAEGEYADAVEVFEEAYDFADPSEESEVLFYLGFTNAMMGEVRLAVEALEYVEPNPSADYFADLVLLKGQLLTETFAYEEAITWLETYSPQLNDASATQMSLLLAGVSYKGIGNTSQAKQSLEKALAIDATSDAGKAAQSLIGEL